MAEKSPLLTARQRANAAYRNSPVGRKLRADYAKTYYKIPEVRARFNKKKRDRRREQQDKEATRLQPEFCECCGRAKKLKFDHDHDHDHDHNHDHSTEKFRGWLCDQCNTGIGKLGDNLVGLQRAVDYLNEKFNGR